MIRTRPHWRKHHSIPRIVFVTALLLLFPLRNARADSIYANAGSSIVKIDPATGAESTLASAPGPFQGISTFDLVGGWLLYTASTGTGTALVSVNVDTGSVSQVALPGFYGFIEFDPVTRRIYASTGSAIVAIDPATGAESTLNSAPNGFQGISTFDVVGRRLLYTASTGTGTALVSVNVDTGSVSQVALPGFYGFIEFDSVTRMIYASTGSAIVAIDPGTGTQSTLNSAPNGFQGISTFDVVGRRLLY